MLQITIPGGEKYDEAKNLFIYSKEQTITLEHSLLSISKWEAKWKKPFLNNPNKTVEEQIDYIRCMTITPNVDPNVFYGLTVENKQEIYSYINDAMTATWFSKKKEKAAKDVITSELIYYWMIALNIPFECQKWHLNRLLVLVKICNEKNDPKKMSKNDLRRRNKSLNEARREAMHTRG